MLEVDKEAFERWFLEYPSWIVTMSRQESCSKAWKAACEYKQKEIDELRNKLSVAGEALELIAMDNIYLSSDGWRD